MQQEHGYRVLQTPAERSSLCRTEPPGHGRIPRRPRCRGGDSQDARNDLLRLHFAYNAAIDPTTNSPVLTLSQQKRYGLARVLSKLGYCSRSRAIALVEAGRVALNGRIERNPERPTSIERDRIEVDGAVVRAAERVYLALNKPRGLIVSAADERGRDTIYSLLQGIDAPWLSAVGRLDRASEGLLLLTNDPQWAARITDPQSAIEKVYHVQVNRVPEDSELKRMHSGVVVDGEHLAAVRARVVRTGAKNAWLEIVLGEGRNRHIRRLMHALGFEVLRLIRISIGPIALSTLPKGQWRHLSAEERVAVLDREHNFKGS
jgi:23S rRNA pseudouridine2605 synthase